MPDKSWLSAIALLKDEEVDAAVESRFFSEDEDCVGAAQPLEQFDLRTSTHSQPDSSVPGVR